MEYQFRKDLRAGKRLIGTMVTLGAPEVTEILVKAGFDWLFLDAEHAPFDALQLQRVLQAAGPQTPCLVRLAAAAEVDIKKALDVGAAGIIAPMVNTPEQAKAVVRAAKYAPDGARGVGLSRALGYGFGLEAHLRAANDEVTVVVQAEHIEAVENIEAIVQTPGLDAVLIGPYDLSASLGRLGEVDHPEVVSAIGRVRAACQSAGLPLGIFGVSAAAVEPYIAQGYTLITAGADILFLGQAAAQLAAQLKA